MKVQWKDRRTVLTYAKSSGSFLHSIALICLNFKTSEWWQKLSYKSNTVWHNIEATSLVLNWGEILNLMEILCLMQPRTPSALFAKGQTTGSRFIWYLPGSPDPSLNSCFLVGCPSPSWCLELFFFPLMNFRRFLLAHPSSLSRSLWMYQQLLPAFWH